MKIYDRPGFPNPSRIRIVLAEKGLDKQVEFISVDLIAAEHKKSDFLKLNPSGILPVLQLEDGTLITECTAITEYLDNLDSNPVLTGKSPLEKGLIHMMQRRAESFVIDPVGNYFHYGTQGLGTTLQSYKSPQWTSRGDWAQREKDKVLEGFNYFNSHLKTHPFLANEKFSMADITLFAGLNFAEAAGLTIDKDLNHLHQWRAEITKLPSVQNRSGKDFVYEDLKRLGFV